MLQSGDIITLDGGPCVLRAQLAGSAYGVVWRASAASGGAVALKLINRTQMARAQPDMQARWVASADNEIAFLASLAPWDERHIVRLLDQGMHDGLPVMALELMDTDLARHLAQMRISKRRLGLHTVLHWMGQTNQALAKVHQYGWLYLDLKPANILLQRQACAIKLADFGTNRLRSALPAACYTGTASWQAPEQFFPNAAGTWDTDTRSDYFALGALFYYLVTGGVQLRFCADCGHAYRAHQAGGAAALLSRHGGRWPVTLHQDEAALFAQHIDHHIDSHAAGASDATWSPSGASAPATAALELLRSLLAPERNERPRHAIDISRMLGAVGRATTPAMAPLMAPKRPLHSWSSP